MNGYCDILGCFIGTQRVSDCPSDGWNAIQVYRDGNVIELGGPFPTEEEAEECADRLWREQLGMNGQFGVGA